METVIIQSRSIKTFLQILRIEQLVVNNSVLELEVCNKLLLDPQVPRKISNKETAKYIKTLKLESKTSLVTFHRSRKVMVESFQMIKTE